MLDDSSMIFPETAHFSGRVVHCLIEDYLDKNYSNVTINDLINIPLPVNESLVLAFEGFKRAYESLEKQNN